MAKTDDNKTTQVSELLAAIDEATHEDEVSIGHLVEIMGERSFASILLGPALIMVTPFSGIPGSPTIFATIVVLIVGQMLMGRSHFWLPEFVRRRRLSSRRIAQAIGFLRRPVRYVEPLLRERLTFLAVRPGNYPALVICLLIAFIGPVMEFMPFLISLAALVISFFAIAILVRDGLVIIVGYLGVILWVLFLRTFLG